MTAQLDITFGGKSYDPELDGERLTRALDLVLQALRSGGWWTLAELAKAARCTEAGASARLRDLRKAQHGSHIVARRRSPERDSLWQYRLMDPTPDYPRAA